MNRSWRLVDTAAPFIKKQISGAYKQCGWIALTKNLREVKF